MLKEEYKNIFENQETHWWPQGMKRINISFLNKYLKTKKNLKILDAGCGTGAVLSYLQNYGQTIGIDISNEALKYAKQIGQVQKGDVTSVPFKDDSFDLVVCLDVLYHLWVKDYQKALTEFNRVLKKGGILLLREPAFDWLKSSHDLIEYGKRRFSKGKMRRALKTSSFEILKLTYTNFFLFPLILLKRLPEILGLKKKRAKSDITKMPQILNALFLNCLKTEAFLLRYLNFPIGSSVICVAKKKA